MHRGSDTKREGGDGVEDVGDGVGTLKGMTLFWAMDLIGDDIL